MSFALRLLSHIGRPLRLLDIRVSKIEQWLQVPLNPQDERCIREACRLTGGKRFGEFYHWYLQKLLVARTVRKIDKRRALQMVAQTDHTDYAPIETEVLTDHSALIAIPHHAHYVFSMIALAERLRAFRKVYIFYGKPETHQGNEVFDRLNAILWGPGSNIEVIHDTRQGLAKAIAGLRHGAVVFIMPDVFQDEQATLAIPFCGRVMNVMLGTATLARKTGARIIPLLSVPAGSGLGFRSLAGTPILPPRSLSAATPEAQRVADYAITRQMFDQFEAVMGSQILYWQNMRQHLAQEGEITFLGEDRLDDFAQLLEADPALRPPRMVVDLRAFQQ